MSYRQEIVAGYFLLVRPVYLPVEGHGQAGPQNLPVMGLLRGIYNYDSTSIRRPFDCLSEFIKVAVT